MAIPESVKKSFEAACTVAPFGGLMLIETQRIADDSIAYVICAAIPREDGGYDAHPIAEWLTDDEPVLRYKAPEGAEITRGEGVTEQ